DSDPDDDPTSGAVVRGSAQPGGREEERSKEGGVSVEPGADDLLMEATRMQLDALFRYSITGDSAYLLAPQRPLMMAQNEDGDTSVKTSSPADV
ncbi:hypothetical protein XENOCAPTIV_009322, partial [Xenoophorus captivus]